MKPEIKGEVDMTSRDNYGATTTTDEVLDGIDLSGKLVVITGGASGLGMETARAMAANGAHIVIPARDMARGEAAAQQTRAATGNDQIEVMELDLGSMASTRAFAEAFLARYDHIDLLINNAGVMACPYSETADGLEMQFGTNHIGHFLLTNLLMPALLKGAKTSGGGRIVNLSSRGHHRDYVHFDDPNFKNRDYDKWASYGQAKTANVLFSIGLEKRVTDKGVHAYAVHPGGIMTALGRHLTEEDIRQLMARMTENSGDGPAMKSVEAGAATTCYAATAPELEGKGGVYLEDCHIAEIDDKDPVGSVRSYAVDSANAEKLWALSEKIVGQKFAV
jgi:NAD(P)-dependent dehydrogenase (short-subunit alcohol dehydrogenase family)